MDKDKVDAVFRVVLSSIVGLLLGGVTRLHYEQEGLRAEVDSLKAEKPSTTYRLTAPAGLYCLPRVGPEPTVDSAVVHRDSFDRRPPEGGVR